MKPIKFRFQWINGVMRCPECFGPLLPAAWHGVPVHQCGNCRGLWFDHGAQPLGAATEPRETSATRRFTLARRCPRCSLPLRPRRYVAGASLLVDLCPGCHGIYVSLHDQRATQALQRRTAPLQRADGPELDRLAAWYDQEIDRDLTVWDWLFQFFTQLPVEINVPPRRVPVVNWALVLVNALAFLALATRLDLAIEAWGLYPARMLAGEEPWRLLSSMFIHGGAAHLIGNLYFLYIMGDNVEDQLGPLRYLLFYLGCGLAAALAMVALNPALDRPMVGASGAISGVIGAYLVACPKARLTLMLVIFQFKLPAWVSLWGWAVVQLVSWRAGIPGVAWEAHLGGFFCGLLVMWVIRARRAG